MCTIQNGNSFEVTGYSKRKEYERENTEEKQNATRAYTGKPEPKNLTYLTLRAEKSACARACVWCETITAILAFRLTNR